MHGQPGASEGLIQIVTPQLADEIRQLIVDCRSLLGSNPIPMDFGLQHWDEIEELISRAWHIAGAADAEDRSPFPCPHSPLTPWVPTGSHPLLGVTALKRIIPWLETLLPVAAPPEQHAKHIGPDFVSPVSQAIAHMNDYFKTHRRLMPEKEIEQLVGKSRKTLAKDPQYKATRASIKDQLKDKPVAGYYHGEDRDLLEASDEIKSDRRRVLRGPHSDD